MNIYFAMIRYMFIKQENKAKFDIHPHDIIVVDIQKYHHIANDNT